MPPNHKSPWERYCELMSERPEAFAQNTLLPIITNPDAVADFVARTGREIGVVYESPYRLMVVDLVQGPNGPFAYERLLPVSKGMGVVIMPFWQGKCVLLQQYRHALRDFQLAFPRGFGENGLSPEENAAKEIAEELQAEVFGLAPLGHITPDSGLTNSSAAVFLAQISKPKLMANYEEIIEIVALSLRELDNAICKGRIQDGFTLAARGLYSVKSNLV